MNMQGLIRKFAERTGRSFSDSEACCKDMVALIMQSLLDGDDINIYGFMRLFTTNKRGHTLTGVDGLTYTSPDKRVLRCKCGKAFERRLNGERIHPEDAV